MNNINIEDIEVIPKFIKITDYSILDKRSGKLLDCRQTNHIRAACDMYNFVTYPEKNGKRRFVKLYYQRIVEYLIKHEHPYIKPNPFNNFVALSEIKGDGISKSIPVNKILSNNSASLVAKFFTSDDINIAIEKCRLTGNATEESKINFIELYGDNKVEPIIKPDFELIEEIEKRQSRTGSLLEVCDSVFIYNDDKQLKSVKKSEYSEIEYLKFDYTKQSLEKIDLAVYNLLRKCVINTAKATGIYDLILCFDALDRNYFLKSKRLKIWVNALDVLPERLVVYSGIKDGEVYFFMEYIGHTPKPLMKIDVSKYPSYFIPLV